MEMFRSTTNKPNISIWIVYYSDIPKKMISHVDIPVEKNDLNEKDVNVLLESVNLSVSKKLHSHVDIPIKN